MMTLGLLVHRPSISSLLQSATSVITKCDSFFYYKVRWSVITKCDSSFISKSATGITKCDSTRPPPLLPAPTLLPAKGSFLNGNGWPVRNRALPMWHHQTQVISSFSACNKLSRNWSPRINKGLDYYYLELYCRYMLVLKRPKLNFGQIQKFKQFNQAFTCYFHCSIISLLPFHSFTTNVTLHKLLLLHIKDSMC